MELFVNTDTRSKLPVTSFDQENSFEKNNTITADIPITSHAMIVGIKISKENVSFGTCSSIIAGRGIYIIYLFKIFEVSAFAPLWFQWLITFVLIDFVFYFYHRCSHRSRFLWAIHMSHHSSEEMNFAVSFRQAWLGPISKIPFFK